MKVNDVCKKDDNSVDIGHFIDKYICASGACLASAFDEAEEPASKPNKSRKGAAKFISSDNAEINITGSPLLSGILTRKFKTEFCKTTADFATRILTKCSGINFVGISTRLSRVDLAGWTDAEWRL